MDPFESLQPMRRHATRGRIALALTIMLVMSMIGTGVFSDGASGQTGGQDNNCSFSIFASERGHQWWELSVACEFTRWSYIDVQGFGVRGSAPVANPPECQKYGDQDYGSGGRYQSHVCGPAGLEVQDQGAYLSGSMDIKVNKKAVVGEGYSARTLYVELYSRSHPGLHGAGDSLIAKVDVTVPKNRVEPAPTDCPTPSDIARNEVRAQQANPEDCPPTSSPEPTPSETIQPSPSPSPTGPVLVLTKTADPKTLKATESDPTPTATWTVKVRNVGNAAYEGRLQIYDNLPDIWNLIPTQASVAGPMGFSEIGVFYTYSDTVKVEGGLRVGSADAYTSQEGDGSLCRIDFRARKNARIHTWEGKSFSAIFSDRRAEKLRGSASIFCITTGRLEPGGEIVMTITGQRSVEKTGDVKLNHAAASWDQGRADARAAIELDGFNSVVEDIDPVVPLGHVTGFSGTATEPGRGFYGTEDPDEASGSRRSDVLMGHYGGDVLRGLAGRDILSGGVGNDRLIGGGERDGIVGGSGADTLEGGAGNDLMVGGPDSDRLSGGAGNDRIEARDGERDVVDCGRGRDTALVDSKDKVKNCERVTQK